MRRIRLAKRPLGAFARNAGMVMTGTFAAQALPLLFYPVFSRVYSPASFGTFATVATISAALAILASGTFEQALLLVRSDRDAVALFRYAVRRCLVVVSAAMVAIIFGRQALAHALSDPALELALLAVPLVAFGQAYYNCTAEWLVRATAFGRLTFMRIVQSSVLALPKLGFGLALGPGAGLVWGEAVGRAIYMAYSYLVVWRAPLDTYVTGSARMALLARRYRSFPRLMVPDQLINTLGGSIHVLFIGYAFGPTQLGFISLLFSALYLPITVVSSSVKDVFRQRANIDFIERGDCRPLYLRLLIPVTLLGFAGFGLLYLISPWVFVLVFGEQWAPVGDYARILIPFFFFNFVSMSLGGILVIAERMSVSLAWQVVNLLLGAIALTVGIAVFGTITMTLVLFSLARSISYLLYMALSYYYARRTDGVAVVAAPYKRTRNPK